MFDVPKLYITACSNSVQLVPLKHVTYLIVSVKKTQAFFSSLECLSIHRSELSPSPLEHLDTLSFGRS